MKLTLWKHQEDSVRSAVQWVDRCDKQRSGIIIAPTGAGKSLIIAELVKEFMQSQPVVVLTSSVTVLTQDYNQYTNQLDNQYNDFCGIYCAGLNKKESLFQVTFCSIDSYISSNYYPNGCILIIDESQSLGSDDSMRINKIKSSLSPDCTIGLTAFPGRSDCGMQHGVVFDDIIFEITYKSLLDLGIIVPIKIPFTSIGTELTLDSQIQQMNELSRGFDNNLIFASNIDSCKKIAEFIGDDCVEIHTSMKPGLREESLQKFTSGQVSTACNVDMLTVGFDMRDLYCITILRKIQSLSLWIQILGRVMRSYKGKSMGYVIDFGGNIDRFGIPPYFDTSTMTPAKEIDNDCDQVEIEVDPKENNDKECPSCFTVNKPTAVHCERCNNVLNDLTMIPTCKSNTEKWHRLQHVEFKQITSKKGEDICVIELNSHCIMIFPDRDIFEFPYMKSCQYLKVITGAKKITPKMMQTVKNSTKIQCDIVEKIYNNVSLYKTVSKGKYTNIIEFKTTKGKIIKL